MLLGAGGFIGRAILSELAAHGHEVAAVVRPDLRTGVLPECVRTVRLDLAKATAWQDWDHALEGIEVVVNAAGVLRGPDMTAVHVTMPLALHEAALKRGVKRVVLISAISARRDVPTDYARTKLAGEDALKDSGLAWTILRPSLVYGAGSYGGTSLLRGLAALPWRIPLPGDGSFAFSPIHLHDLAQAVRIACEKNELTGQVLEPCGPDTMPVSELLARYRRWLGFGEARFLNLSMALMRLLGRTGDILGRGPVSSNSLAQLVAGNGGDGQLFARAIGFVPRTLDAAMRDGPSQVQDRWHARLFFLAPTIRWLLALMWVGSALVGFGWGAVQASAVIAGLGLPADFAGPLRWAGSLLDLVLAAVVLGDARGRAATILQLLVVAAYTLVIGYAVPEAWLDPLGALLKNIPVMALILVHGAVAEQR